MEIRCRICGKETVLARDVSRGGITHDICEACILQASGTTDKREFLEAIDAPVLLMQGNPRQVVTANGKALKLFQKELRNVEGRRGGEIFDCVHAFTEAGCGKDINCEHCKIKNAIVDTFTTANLHTGVSSELTVRKTLATREYALQVSTQKLGDLALVRIDRYDTET